MTIHDPQKILGVLAASPTIRGEMSRAAERRAAERQAHRDAIAGLDAAATKAYSDQERRKTAALAARDAARGAFAAAEAEVARTFNAVAGERFSYESSRRAHEAALLEPSFPEVAEFLDWLLDEADRVRKLGERVETVERNERTGRSITRVASNATSIRRRMKAILSAREAALDLRLIADPREVPAKIEEIRAALPAVIMAEIEAEGSAK